MGNKTIYLGVIGLLLNGKLEQFLKHLADDITWHLHGFKTMEGKAEAEEMLRQMPWERYTFIARNCMCEGNALIVEGTMQVEDSGMVTEHFYCDVYRFEGDMITEVASYFVFTQPEDLEDEYEED